MRIAKKPRGGSCVKPRRNSHGDEKRIEGVLKVEDKPVLERKRGNALVAERYAPEPGRLAELPDYGVYP